MDTYESRRYDKVKNERVSGFENWKPNTLLSADMPQSAVTQYVDGGLPKGAFKTVDEALTVYRRMFGIPEPGVHPRVQLRR